MKYMNILEVTAPTVTFEKVHRCAKAFQKIGVKENDRVTICMQILRGSYGSLCS